MTESPITADFCDWLHNRARAAIKTRGWFGIDAPDLAQDTLIALHRSINKGTFTYQGEGKWRAYALKIMTNLALNANRSRAGKEALSINTMFREGEGSFDVEDDRRACPVREELLSEMDRAIENLPDLQRHVMQLTQQGAKVAEICRELGKSHTIISKAKFHALAKLKKTLNPEG